MDNKKYMIPALIILFAIFTIFAIFVIYKINVSSLPKCDSTFAEDEVKTIFKQNHYKDFSYNIEMDLMMPEYYDKNLQKYECSARLTISSAKRVSGHKQVYNVFTHSIMIVPDEKLDGREFTANYTIYKERGENKVVARFERRD